MKRKTKSSLHVGERIRQIRKSRKITLIELAEKSGVAQASLSRIETGVMKGTVKSHQSIAEVLGVSLAELYSDVDARIENVLHLVKKSRTVASKKQHQISYEVLTHHASQKKLLPALVTLAPGSETDRERTQAGVDKFLWVVDGKIEVNLGKEVYTLSKGDTLYFDGSLPHALKHLAGTPAKCLTVTSPATL